MKVKFMILALVAAFTASTHAAQETDPMVGCYTLPQGDFHIKITKSGETYSTHFKNNAGIDKSAPLIDVPNQELEGLVSPEEQKNLEKVLAADIPNDLFLIGKYKAGFQPKTDYMAVASMQFGGGPAMKVACK